MKNNDELLRIKELAQRKKELLESIYDISSRRTFLGEQSEIDEFSEYLELREPYYEELREIDTKGGSAFKNFEPDFSSENRLNREVSQLVSEIRDIGGQIVKIDKANNEKMRNVHRELMSEVKSINKTKKVRDSYMMFQSLGK